MKSKNKKNILFLTPGFPANHEDTSCIPALQIYAKQLAKEDNIKISVVATHYPHFAKQYNWNGIEVISLGTRQNIFSKAYSFFKLRYILKKINKKNNIDHIHCFWLNRISFIANSFCLKNKIPLTITFMGQDALATNKVLGKINTVKANFVTVSKYQDTILKKNAKNLESKIIHWGIEEPMENNNTVLNMRDIDLICAGGFSEVKNLQNFIEIVEKIKFAKPDIKVMMIGGGIQEKKLKQFINEKGLNDTIKITGLIPREEVIKIMGRAKILLHTSFYESFGLVLIEALACGCKVISYPVGIAFENKNILTANSTNELIQLVSKELDATKFDAVNEHKISDTISRYLDLYNSLPLNS